MRRKEPLMVDTMIFLSGKYGVLSSPPHLCFYCGPFGRPDAVLSRLSSFPSVGECRVLFEVKSLVKELPVSMFSTCLSDYFWISCPINRYFY